MINHMATLEKFLIENPENYDTSSYFNHKLYGIDASKGSKFDPWLNGIECLFRSDGRDKQIREGSKFSIKTLDVPMNVAKVSDEIKKLLKTH